MAEEDEDPAPYVIATMSAATLEGSVMFITPDEILQSIGLNRRQVAMMIMGGFAYAAYNIQLLIQSLSTESVWEEWPEYSHTMRYNWLFFATGCAKLAGAALLVPLQDYFGRRRILFYALLAMAGASLISAGMPTFSSYVTIRCFAYFVSSAVNCSVYVYQMEMVPIKSRTLPPLITQLWGTTGIVFITAVWWGMASSSRAWRWVAILAVVPAFVAVLFLVFLPLETPRFHCAMGNEEAAWKSFTGLQPGGSEGLARRLGVSSMRKVKLETSHIGKPKSREGVSGFFQVVGGGFSRMGQLMVSTQYRRKVAVCALAWLLQAFAYWGITSYLPTFFKAIGLNPYVSVLVSFSCEYPGMALAYFMMTAQKVWLGRLNTLRFFALGTSLVLAVFAISVRYLKTGHWFLYVPTMLCYFFAAPIWTCLYTYTPELFPTDVRGTAMSIMGIANGIPTLVTFFLGSVAGVSWKYPALWSGVFGLLCLTAVLGLRTETRDLPLDECMVKTEVEEFDDLQETDDPESRKEKNEQLKSRQEIMNFA